MTYRLHLGYVDDSEKFRNGFEAAADFLNSIGFNITHECLPTVEALLCAYDYNTHIGPNTAPTQSHKNPNHTLQEETPPFNLFFTDYHIPTLYQAKHWAAKDSESDKGKDEQLTAALEAMLPHIEERGFEFTTLDPTKTKRDRFWLVNQWQYEIYKGQAAELGPKNDTPLTPENMHFGFNPVEEWVTRDVLGTFAIQALREMEKTSGIALPPIIGFSGKARDWDVDFDIQKYSNGILLSMILPILHLAKNGNLPAEVIPENINYAEIADAIIDHAAKLDAIQDDTVVENGTVVKPAGRCDFSNPSWVQEKIMPKAEAAGITMQHAPTEDSIDTQAFLIELLQNPEIMVAQRTDNPPVVEWRPEIRHVRSRDPKINWSTNDLV